MSLRIAGVALLILGGCTTPLRVTYVSDPAGAMLYSGGAPIGYTPQTLSYEITDDARRSGKMRIDGTRVQWASGATAEAKVVVADLKNGVVQHLVFQRPTGIPGREADVQFALDLQRLQLLERQTQAQEGQAAGALFNAINQSWRVQQPQTCRSTIIGSVISTSCY